MASQRDRASTVRWGGPTPRPEAKPGRSESFGELAHMGLAASIGRVEVRDHLDHVQVRTPVDLVMAVRHPG